MVPSFPSLRFLLRPGHFGDRSALACISVVARFPFLILSSVKGESVDPSIFSPHSSVSASPNRQPPPVFSSAILPTLVFFSPDLLPWVYNVQGPFSSVIGANPNSYWRCKLEVLVVSLHVRIEFVLPWRVYDPSITFKV